MTTTDHPPASQPGPPGRLGVRVADRARLPNIRSSYR